jgi:hypothetical protein
VNAETRIKRDAKMNIAQRINAAMAEVDYIQKEKKQGMNYTIVSHDAVTAKVRPILQGHGVVYYPRDLVVRQDGNRTEAMFNVRFENIDDRTDFIDVATFGYGVDSQDKGPGKAISYGVKYALLKVLGLETGDDPDEVQDGKADHKPSKDTAPFTLGPAKNKTDLKAKGRDFWRDVEACDDEDTLVALIATNKPLIEQIKAELPTWWDGGQKDSGEPFEGLSHVIDRNLYDFRNLNQRTVIDAG